MKVHAYILCFNEEEIIKPVVDYYSSFCSKIFILDNHSTDNSISLVESNHKVHTIYFNSDNTLNDAIHIELKTGMYKNYSRRGGEFTIEVADWVITCDMDELIYHPNILDLLKKYKDHNITVPKVCGFNIIGENSVSQNAPLIEQYGRGIRSKVFDKSIIFDANFDIFFSAGCHPSEPIYNKISKQKNYKTSDNTEIALLHYKTIGNRKYERAKLSLTRLSELNKKNGWGTHYEKHIVGEAIPKLLIEKSRPLFNDKMEIIFD